jgi:hypothetical protein
VVDQPFASCVEVEARASWRALGSWTAYSTAVRDFAGFCGDKTSRYRMATLTPGGRLIPPVAMDRKLGSPSPVTIGAECQVRVVALYLNREPMAQLHGPHPTWISGATSCAETPLRLASITEN